MRTNESNATKKPPNVRFVIVVKHIERLRVRTIKGAIVAILLGPLLGCSQVSRLQLPHRECWSDPEQLSERVRSFRDVTELQVLEGTERLLRLTWGKDVKVIRSLHKLSAHAHRFRLFLLPPFFGYDRTSDESWTIVTRPELNGVVMCVQIQGQSVSESYVYGWDSMTNLIYPATVIEQSRGHFLPRGQPIAINLDTFWARLDYLLGQKEAWTACRSSGPCRNEARNRMEFDPLCHSLGDDPEPPLKPNIERPPS